MDQICVNPSLVWCAQQKVEGHCHSKLPTKVSLFYTSEKIQQQRIFSKHNFNFHHHQLNEHVRYSRRIKSSQKSKNTTLHFSGNFFLLKIQEEFRMMSRQNQRKNQNENTICDENNNNDHLPTKEISVMNLQWDQELFSKKSNK
jgi:hypothetical protein